MKIFFCRRIKSIFYAGELALGCESKCYFVVFNAGLFNHSSSVLGCLHRYHSDLLKELDYFVEIGDIIEVRASILLKRVGLRG